MPSALPDTIVKRPVAGSHDVTRSPSDWVIHSSPPEVTRIPLDPNTSDGGTTISCCHPAARTSGVPSPLSHRDAVTSMRVLTAVLWRLDNDQASVLSNSAI